jgi:hypothetical protein
MLALLAACSSSKTAQPVPASASASASAATSTTSTTDPSTTAATVNPNTPEPNAAGDIPDNTVYVSFAFSGGPFSVTLPEGWARTDSNGSTTFTDNFNSAQLLATASTSTSAPTEQSARDSEVSAIQSSSTNFQLDNVTTVSRKGGTAVLITYKADSAPNAVTGKVRPLAIERYEFWQNGREGVIVLSGPVGADNVDPWRTISDSFAWS